MRTRHLLAAAVALFGLPAAALTCGEVTWKGAPYSYCEVDMASDRLSLHLRREDGDIIGTFAELEAALAPAPLLFAMNAGMFHEDRAPVGHYLEDGEEEMRVIPNAGPGNFGMLPNGVFCIRDGRADVIETGAYLADRPDCRHATQSGPMLVIDGALHPRLLPDGTSRFIRNGVGASSDGRTVVFAISDAAVNFHDFATLFRDRFGLPDALYFDGNVSRMHAVPLDRSDGGWPLGPMVAVTGAP